MKMEQWIRAVAGAFILMSLTIAQVHNRDGLFFIAFVGLKLLPSAFTKRRLMEDIFAKLGIARKSE